MSTETPTLEVSRRTFLAVTAGTGAVALGTTTAAADTDELESWLSDVPNYEGVADHTNEDEVHVTVGANDGFTYDPPAVAVDPGTTVVWEWTGEGGTHDVVDEGDAYSSELVADAGHVFEHTFDDEGVSLYGCTPHIPMGMKGAVLVGEEAAEAAADTAGTQGSVQSIPMLPGVAASLGIIALVTAAISRWTSARRDAARVR